MKDFPDTTPLLKTLDEVQEYIHDFQMFLVAALQGVSARPTRPMEMKPDSLAIVTEAGHIAQDAVSLLNAMRARAWQSAREKSAQELDRAKEDLLRGFEGPKT